MNDKKSAYYDNLERISEYLDFANFRDEEGARCSVAAGLDFDINAVVFYFQCKHTKPSVRNFSPGNLTPRQRIPREISYKDFPSKISELAPYFAEIADLHSNSAGEVDAWLERLAQVVKEVETLNLNVTTEYRSGDYEFCETCGGNQDSLEITRIFVNSTLEKITFNGRWGCYSGETLVCVGEDARSVDALFSQTVNDINSFVDFSRIVRQKKLATFYD